MSCCRLLSILAEPERLTESPLELVVSVPSVLGSVEETSEVMY